jgi:hypothetical protein
MVCCYVLSDKETRYSRQFEQCGCVEGNRDDLINQIKNNPQFCRDQTAINYEYFVDTLEKNSIIYINNSDNKILGACSINLGRYITIDGICVPFDDSIKGIGTILLNKVKCIGKLIKASAINLSANTSVRGFYEKNGFVIKDTSFNTNKRFSIFKSLSKFAETDDDDDDDDDNDESTRIKMTYKFEKTPAKGGKRKTTSQKSKRKNKQCKITKKRNKNFSTPLHF